MIQKCFLVKHNNGQGNNIPLQNILLIVSSQVNELIDWKNAVQGVGVINNEYENIEINIHCTFERNNKKFPSEHDNFSTSSKSVS